MTTILIVEDEPSFTEVLDFALTKEGYEVIAAADGRQGLEAFRRHQPDLVLLDLMLPVLSGLDVLKGIRAEAATPVIVVSAKDAEADVVAALELGADDYVRKPYSVRELIARIRTASRRGHPPAATIVLGNVILDLGALRLRIGETEVDLPKKEFEVLQMLMEQPGKVIPRERLLDEVWGYSWIGETRTLDQHIRRLRRRLEADPDAPRIETVRGVGYRIRG